MDLRTKLLSRPPANAEMIQGFIDGYDVNCPEPSANRSHSYRHGFANGRADITHKSRGSFDWVLAEAERCMKLDEEASTPSLERAV